MELIAHKALDDRTQLFADHANNVAALAGEFAAAFGAQEPARILGLLHDMAGCNIVFHGLENTYAFEELEIRDAWERYCKETENTYRSQCLITGKLDLGVLERRASLPSRERVLKSVLQYSRLDPFTVAPLAGAWILSTKKATRKAGAMFLSNSAVFLVRVCLCMVLSEELPAVTPAENIVLDASFF